MFQLLKKLQINGRQNSQRKNIEQLSRRSGSQYRKSNKSFRSTSTRRTKQLKKQRIDYMFEKLKSQVDLKLRKFETKLTQIVLEESSIQQSSLEDGMDDWKQNHSRKLSQIRKLERPSQVALKKHTLVVKKPNQLTDEELSQ